MAFQEESGAVELNLSGILDVARGGYRGVWAHAPQVAMYFIANNSVKKLFTLKRHLWPSPKSSAGLWPPKVQLWIRPWS